MNYKIYLKNSLITTFNQLKKQRHIGLPQSLHFRYRNLSEYSYASQILNLSERGIWKDRFPHSSLEFEKDLGTKSLTVYAGFDPTADSLHIGNLLVLNSLIHFQREGHKVLVVIGGATARIGDPSGKNKERPVLETEEIDKNCDGIQNIIENVFRNHENFIWNSKTGKSLKPVRIINNYSWYKHVNILDFMRDVGKHLRMGSMLRRTTIDERLTANKPLSYTEFSYQTMQAYDWLYLYKKYDCTVQIGGSDQMGNIVTGHELISRKEDVQVTGLTLPLITSESGDKLGKSSGDPIWLATNRTSPFDFYQFFVRVKDSEVENLLKLLTFIPLSDIEETMKLHQETPEKKYAQKRLAKHLTLLVHGEEGLLLAKRATNLLYGGDSTELVDMKASDVIDVFKGSTMKSLLLKPGMSILELAMLAGCFPNEKRALEIIEAGGLYVNQARVTNPSLVLIQGVHILPNGLSLIRVGKRNYFIVKWT